MNMETLTINSLFAQLGLANTDSAVMDFLHTHAPLHLMVPLHEFSLWNLSQAAFLQQAIAEDSDWCALVDQLDALLRQGA